MSIAARPEHAAPSGEAKAHVAPRPRAGGLVLRMLRRHWMLALPLLASCFTFRAWLSPSTLISGGDFPPFSESIVAGGGWPHLWTDLHFGFSLLYWASAAPLWALGGLLQGMGVGYPLVERVLWLWPFMLGAPLCGYYLCYRLTRSPAGAAVGATLFALNTWTIGLAQRGHIPSLEAYMLFGLVLPLIFALTGRPTYRAALLLAGLLSLQMVFDPRYGYESLFLICVASLLALPRLLRDGDLSKLVACGVLLAGGLVALNLDLILPMVLSPRSPSAWISTTAFEQASHFGSLLAGFSLYFPFYHYLAGGDGFAETPPEVPLLLVAFAGWFGLLLARQRRPMRILLLFATLGIVLVSATKGPFAALDKAIFEHVPGFAIFRDFTKFYAFIAPAYAVGVASLVAAATAFVRLRLPAARRPAVPLGVVLTFAYMIVMRDALNPLRGSNFAPTGHFGKDAEASERFLRDNLGDARVLMFPGDVRVQRRDRLLSIADAGFVAQAPPPLGYAELNPALSGADSILAMFASPLAPALLRELRVKYIVVPDDWALYYAFDGRPARWSCVDFLRTQSWLRKAAVFGDNIIFEVRGPSVEPAFFAPFPALVVGSPATLEGLVDSPLGGERAADMIADQMPAKAEWLATLPNVVRGPTLIDPEALLGPGGATGAAKRLADAGVSERYKRRAFAADVFSSAMLAQSLQRWNFESPFAFRFQTTYGDGARASFLLERRKKIPSVLVRNSGQVAVFSAGDQGTILGSGAACSPAPFWSGRFDAAVETIQVAEANPRKTLFVENPCPIAYVGTLALHVTSGDGLPLPVELSFGNVTRRVIVPPNWLAPLGAGWIKLSDVVLRPGLNLLALSKNAERPVAVNAKYEVSDLHGLGGEFQPYPLQLSVRHSPAGDLVYASIDVPRAGMHVGYLDLFGPLDLGLDQHPLCTFKYTMSNVPGSFSLLLDLRDRDSGKAVSLWVPLAHAQVGDYDLYALVRDLLREEFARNLAYHRDDPLWVAQHFANGPRNPNDFILRRVRVAATWSVFESSDVPHGSFIALVRGLRLATSAGLVGTRWAYPQTALVDTDGVSEKNFTLRGMKILRIGSARGLEGRVDAQLSGYTPSGYRLATSLHVGDYVQLALQNDRKIAGTIVAESSDYVLVQDGDGAPQRVARGSISTVAQQEITRSANLEVPISAPFVPTQLSFNVRTEDELKVRIGLVYRGADGNREYVSAVDRDETDESGVDAEPDFVKPTILTGGTVFDLAVPIDLSLAQPPLARWISYDIDLWSVERYRFGDSQHQLVGLTLEFDELRGSPGDRQFSVALADLTASRDRLFNGDITRSAIDRPLVRLDGADLKVSALRDSAESAGYLHGEAASVALAPGSHVIQSQPLDEVRVRAVTLFRGSATALAEGRVTHFATNTPSEQTGALTGGGVLVVSRVYDPGWVLALWPPGSEPPALTGFALYDLWRCVTHVLPGTFHVPANGGIEAWYVPPGVTAERRFVMLYEPEAYCELGAMLSLPVLLAVLGLAAYRRVRGRP